MSETRISTSKKRILRPLLTYLWESSQPARLPQQPAASSQPASPPASRYATGPHYAYFTCLLTYGKAASLSACPSQPICYWTPLCILYLLAYGKAASRYATGPHYAYFTYLWESSQPACLPHQPAASLPASQPADMLLDPIMHTSLTYGKAASLPAWPSQPICYWTPLCILYLLTYGKAASLPACPNSQQPACLPASRYATRPHYAYFTYLWESSQPACLPASRYTTGPHYADFTYLLTYLWESSLPACPFYTKVLL